jgi:hypothetical protein
MRVVPTATLDHGKPLRMPYSTLERMLAAVLRQAAQDNRFDGAEHLLRALELLANEP